MCRGFKKVGKHCVNQILGLCDWDVKGHLVADGVHLWDKRLTGGLTVHYKTQLETVYQTSSLQRLRNARNLIYHYSIYCHSKVCGTLNICLSKQ